MIGQMMNLPLTISSLLVHAEKYHAETQIVSIETSGEKRRSNWGEVGARSRQLADVLTRMGLRSGDRCGTIAWNNLNHLEVYFGTSGAGYVMHTINPRLSPAELTYIINHAEDRVLFFEESFLPLIIEISPQLSTVEKYVVFSSTGSLPENASLELSDYSEFVSGGNASFQWPAIDEQQASSLCYTSGTTGNPKGVLYSHRSTVLHCLVGALPDCMNMSARTVVMPVVPMFHVNAWGVPCAAAMAGACLVFPGPTLDGESRLKLSHREEVTLERRVPTISPRL